MYAYVCACVYEWEKLNERDRSVISLQGWCGGAGTGCDASASLDPVVDIHTYLLKQTHT